MNKSILQQVFYHFYASGTLIIILLSGNTFAIDTKHAVIEYIINNYLNKIYYTKRVNNSWTEPVEAPFLVNQNMSLCNLSADGNRLYLGKEDDIWVIGHSNGEWGTPKRLLFPINSSSCDGAYTESNEVL